MVAFRFLASLEIRAVLCIALAFLLLNTVPGALAQPTVAPCGLPTGGFVDTLVSYTLTANCTQTDTLEFGGNVGGTVVIDGKGFKIDASALRTSKAVFTNTSSAKLDIKDVTIEGGGAYASGVMHLGEEAKLTNVTFRGHYNAAVSRASGSGGTWTFENILVENGGGQYGFFGARATAFTAKNGAIFNITNLVVRDLIGGNAALQLDYWQYQSPTAINISGCFTHERIFPALTFRTINDNSTGKCTGTIGNGDNAVKTVAAPVIAACGLPTGGHLESTTPYVFNLVGNCQQTKSLYIAKGVTVTINGNGYSIYGKPHFILIRTGGTLTIRNVVIRNSGRPISAFLQSNLLIEDSIFRENTGPIVLADHIATFNRVKFEDNSTTYSWSKWPSALRIIRKSDVILRDSLFINNTGPSAAAMWVGDEYPTSLHARVRFENSITWQGNSPDDYIDTKSRVEDNTGGTLAANFELSPPPPKPSKKIATGQERRPVPQLPPDACRLPIGAIACIYRGGTLAQGTLQVWGITPQSTGFHQLTVTKAQVDALPDGGLVGITSDCRARVMREQNGDITVSVGPNPEGKLLHAVLDQSLHGSVISTYSTYGETLCPGPAAPGPAQLQNCMVKTTHPLNFRRSPGGDVLRGLPPLVTLTAFQRAPDWFYVDYHGERGWISADYVIPQGSCG